MMRKFLYLGFILSAALFISSCATVPVETLPPPLPPPLARTATIHTVAPGETLWRISKMYDVPVAAIVQVNNLKDSGDIKMGQRLEVPSAAPIRPVITLYPSRKWRYIIIHHSATDEGSSLSIHKSHLNRGWERGVGYHFVIDNGSSSKKDGQIETSPRWLKQEDGSHCRASGMNSKAIGICLVGNFDHENVTQKQMESLIYLVNTLKKYYRISPRNILRHGEVLGARTACPGRRFPWKEVKSKLR